MENHNGDNDNSSILMHPHTTQMPQRVSFISKYLHEFMPLFDFENSALLQWSSLQYVVPPQSYSPTENCHYRQ